MFQTIGQQDDNFKKVSRVILLLNILNIGNYTFLAYSLSGAATDSLLGFTVFLRLPLSVLPILWIYIAAPNAFRGYISFLKRNKDVNIFCALIFITSLISASPFNSILYGLWTVATLYSILLYLFLLAVNSTIRQYMKIFSIFLITINGVILILVTPSLSNIYNIGPEAVYFTSKSIYALPVAAIAAAGISYLLHKQERKFIVTIFIYTLLTICFLALLGSGKRTAFISVSVSLIIYLLYQTKKLAFLVLLLLPFFWERYTSFIESTTNMYKDESYTMSRLNRLDTKGQDIVDDSSYEARIMLWDYFLKIYYDNAIFGIGLNNREVAEMKYKKKNFLGELSYHNSYLHLLVELGLPAFLMFIFILFRSFFLVFRNSTTRVKFQYLVLLIPALAISWVETNTLPGQILFLYVFLVWLFPRVYLVPKYSVAQRSLIEIKKSPDFSQRLAIIREK